MDSRMKSIHRFHCLCKQITILNIVVINPEYYWEFVFDILGIYQDIVDVNLV